MHLLFQLASDKTIDDILKGPKDFSVVLLILFIISFPMLSFYMYNIWQIRRWENAILPKKGLKSDKHLSVVYMCAAVILMQSDLREREEKKNALLRAMAEINPEYSKVATKLGEIWEKQVRVSHLVKWMNSRLNEEERENIIYFLIEISYLDGSLLASEFKLIEEFARSVQISPKQVRQMIASHKQKIHREYTQREQKRKERRKKYTGKSARDRAFDVLGVSKHSAREEIKKAYRKLVKKFHPDRYVGKSLPEIEAAQGRFIEIQQAYELICD